MAVPKSHRIKCKCIVLERSHECKTRTDSCGWWKWKDVKKTGDSCWIESGFLKNVSIRWAKTLPIRIQRNIHIANLEDGKWKRAIRLFGVSYWPINPIAGSCNNSNIVLNSSFFLFHNWFHFNCQVWGFHAKWRQNSISQIVIYTYKAMQATDSFLLEWSETQ